MKKFRVVFAALGVAMICAAGSTSASATPIAKPEPRVTPPGAGGLLFVGASRRGFNIGELTPYLAFGKGGESYFQFPTGGIAPQYSPKRDWIAYEGVGLPRKVYVVRSTDKLGQWSKRLIYTSQTSPGQVQIDLVDWAPKGDFLLLREWGSTSGQPLTRFLKIPIQGGTPQAISVPSVDQVVDADVSPDGASIVFEGAVGTPPVMDSNIYSMNVDGTGVRQLTNGNSDHDPEFSPDGSTIDYVRNGADIVQMSANGSNASPVQGASGRFLVSPTFSPGGKQIAWIGEFNRIYVADRDGSHKTRIGTRFGPTYGELEWSP